MQLQLDSERGPRHRAEMRLYKLGWLFVLLGCKDSEHFIPLEALCRQVSEDICDARTCCGPVDEATCLEAENARCTLQFDQYVKEQQPALRYDSSSADDQASANRAVLATCTTVPPLATYFEGGAALGTPCERDAQCASGSCLGEPRVCAEPAAPVPLCPPAVP